MSSGVRPPFCAASVSGTMAIATGTTSRHTSAFFRGVIPTLPLLTVRGLYTGYPTGQWDEMMARSVGCITTVAAISLLAQRPPRLRLRRGLHGRGARDDSGRGPGL